MAAGESFLSAVGPSTNQATSSWQLSLDNNTNSPAPVVETNREVCFGSIAVSLSRKENHVSEVVFPISARAEQVGSDIFVICSLKMTGEAIVVISDDQTIGKLCPEHDAVLKGLRDRFVVRFEGLLEVKKAGNLYKADLSATMTIDTDVYGHKTDGDAIGQALEQGRMFLQDPISNSKNIQHFNPQWFDLGPYDENLLESLPTLAEARPSQHTSSDADISETEELPDVINRFAKHDSLGETDANERVCTPLLVHQKQALKFMLSREAGSSHSSLTLWNDISSEGTNLYQHRITGAKSPVQREALGGILADDMGLGKSLSVLSAVAGTLNDAIHHAQLVNNMSSEEVRSKPLPAKSTLILVPSTLLILSWLEEIRRHVHYGALSVYEYHGNSRKVTFVDLLSHDIVVTTYATLATEQRRKQKSFLHKVYWYRVVLDEAHVIRNPASKQYMAAAALSAQNRWCLTGTPIQNSLTDLSSLIRFLRLPLLENQIQFRRHIVSKVERLAEDQRPDYENLQCLLEAICLRRTKQVLEVPPSEETRRELKFSAEERAAYTALSHRCREAMDRAVSGRRSKETHQTVLHALLRLRMFCNNASFYGNPLSSSLTGAEEIESLLQQHSEEIRCYNCANDLLFLSWADEDACGRVTGCHQFVCTNCLGGYRKQAKDLSHCPICKEGHNLFLKLTNETETGEGKVPTKLLDLVEQVQHFRHYGHDGKGIVFSFWKKSLDIVETLFRREGIPYLRVDGSLPSLKRSQVLADFQKGSGSTILLMTFSTGAVGLNNLSVATHVHILEPQWNPSVESQAIGRLVRLGQEHSVQVIRYLMKKTVEVHVQKRQVGKIGLARGGFESDSSTWLKEVLNKI